VSLVSAFLVVLAILIGAVLWACSAEANDSGPRRARSRRLAKQPDRADDDPEDDQRDPAPVQQPFGAPR
jgi:hypothetical protein